MQFPYLSKQIYWAAGLVFLINSLILNDVNTILPRGELSFLGVFTGEQAGFSLTGWLSAGVFSDLSEDLLFPLRLFSLLFLLTSMALFFSYGKKLFGKSRLLVMLLVLISSLVLPCLSKFVLADFWVLPFQVSAALGMVRYLKQPANKWRLLTWGAIAGGTLLAPLHTFALIAVLFLCLRFMHPQGRALGGLYVWLYLAVFGLAGYFTGFFSLEPLTGYFFEPAALDGILVLSAGLGFLPWLGFLLAGLWELINQARKREEMALILLSLLLATVVSGSLLVHFVLALIIARQVHFFFEQAYPYSALVKAVSTLHIIAIFCLSIVAMMLSFYYLEGAGYRRMMLIGAAYWIPSFLSIVGLYGGQARYALGGMAAAGLLAVFCFWTLGGPIVEAKRSLPKRAVERLLEWDSLGPPKKLYYEIENQDLAGQIRFYAREKFEQTTSGIETLTAGVEDAFIIGSGSRLQTEIKNLPVRQIEKLEGWSGMGMPDSLWLFRAEHGTRGY